MAKSRTPKKSAKIVDPDALLLINGFTSYVKHWTNAELGKLHANGDASICIPTNNGYKIGLYKLVVYPNKTCAVFDAGGAIIHTFESKISAVIYTIYTIKRRYSSADQLIALDKEINKNYMDMLALRRGLTRARKLQDYVSVDIKQARLDDAEMQFNRAKSNILAMHNSAKFNKVWQ